jgi:hypothetical protein
MIDKSQTRKTLVDAVASDFVYGSGESATKTVAPTNNATSPMPQPTIMQKLQLEPKEATKRFTIDLSEGMHRKLSILSARTGRTKADIVRMMLDEMLVDVAD